MEENKLTVKEVFERIERLFGTEMVSDVKFNEFAIRSLVRDVFEVNDKYFE